MHKHFGLSRADEEEESDIVFSSGLESPVSTCASQELPVHNVLECLRQERPVLDSKLAPAKKLSLQLEPIGSTASTTKTGLRTQSQATTRKSVSAVSPASPSSSLAGRSSVTSIRRAMTGLSGVFHTKRQSSPSDKASEKMLDRNSGDSPVFRNVDYNASNNSDTATIATLPAKPSNRFSFYHSGLTTQENSPPTSSPLDTGVASSPNHAGHSRVPEQSDFLSKKNRSSTGFSLRNRVIGFAHQPRRRKSAENVKDHVVVSGAVKTQVFNEREIKEAETDVGVGVKARRLSLSLPDDFAVEVIELESEYQYDHKWRGRHNRIGKGGTSKISTVRRKGFSQELYAAKEFRKKASYETVLEYEKKVKSEFTIGKSLHHPNIVESVRLCTHKGRWNYIMEYCKGGDLLALCQMKYLQQEDRADDRACLVKQLVQGVAYLHRNGIAHRDIKLENLLLTEDSKLKITDFGVSDVFTGIHPGLREAGGQCGVGMEEEIRLCTPGICGSIPYMAPEVFQKKTRYDPRPIDIWSVGMCVLGLIFGGTIWTVPDQEKSSSYANFLKAWDKFYTKHGPDAEVTDKVLNFPKFEPFELFIKSPSLRRLVWRMLSPDPAKRISAAEIMQTRWFRNTACCQPESYDETPCGVDTTKRPGQNLKRTVIHNHRPPVHHGSHSLGKMPGQVGY